MIEPELAKKFIEQIKQCTEYNINIMNEQGIIIASQDSKRVGSFHEVACYIVAGSEDIVVTSEEEDYPGVKPGINMVIKLDGKRVGAVGITGNPEEIKPIALIIRLAIEAMLKYEKQREELRRRRSRKEHFTNLLLYVEYSDPGELRKIANQLNYSESIIRIPILCKLDGFKPEPFLDKIKKSPGHGPEDISFVLDRGHILIFKTMPEKMGKVFADYKYIIAEYLSPAFTWLQEQKKSCKFYIGSFQGSFTQYYYAYQHCKWLEEHRNCVNTAFFYDFAGNYVRSIIPMNELQRMFNIYEKELGEEFKKTFMEIAGALIKTNYNLVSASKELFMHKNTLLYRYNKVKDILNINPIESSADRFFLEAFYSFLRREH